MIIRIRDIHLKYGFCKKSLQKNEALTSCHFFSFFLSLLGGCCWQLVRVSFVKKLDASKAFMTKVSCNHHDFITHLLLSVGSGLCWGTMIPLIGGSAIGCFNSAGTPPAFHLTYNAFKKYEGPLKRYWPDIPTYYLDKEKGPECMKGKTLNLILGCCCLHKF